MQSQYKLLAAIVDYSLREQLGRVMHQFQAPPHVATHGSGFADSEMLEMLGFSENRKSVALVCLDERLVGSFYQGLEEHLNISKKGTGIAFSIPLSGASGFCGRLMERTAHNRKGEGHPMAEPFKYTHELVVTIVTRGSAELVKEAARKSGAMGGTMVHGLGLGGEEAAKFLGISIQPEKDVVLIVVKKSDCPEVMKTIVQECGIETEARGICFSLPVDSAVGLR